MHGASAEEIVVAVETATVAALSVSWEDIARVIAGADEKVSAGSFEGDRFTFDLELRGEIDTLTRLRNVPVKTDAGECLAILVEQRLNASNVLEVLADLILSHGPPDHIRSDNGPEFIEKALHGWLGRLGVKTLYIGDRIRSREAMGKRLLRELQLQA